MTSAASGPSQPFPGLRPFREDEEDLFFGREQQVDAMVDTLAATRFLAVVGVSGSGKSSLVNCGLRPALHRGLMTGAGTSWRVAQFRPGNNPIRAMAEALARDGGLFTGADKGRFSRVDLVETALRMSKAGLLDVYEQAAPAPGTNLLVVADQFEELFRYRALAVTSGMKRDGPTASEEATAFVNLLLEMREQTALPVYVTLTMRSDFLGDCSQFFGLPEAINEGQYLVPRLTRDERRLAITGPIGVGGAQITPVLLTRLVNDVGDNPDQLSILQHALNRTWRQWQTQGSSGPIDLEHYETIGTMAHALDQHAEEAYDELKTDRRRSICRKIFEALTDTTTDPRGTRRPTRMDTLCALAGAGAAEVAEVIEVFRAPARAFLMPPAGEPLKADTVVDISHESLMRAWSRLRRWAFEEAQSAQLYRRLVETAALHEAGKSSLWRDPDLQLALNWARDKQPTLEWAERYRPGFELAMAFLQKSALARDAERQAASRQRLIRIALMVALIAVVGGWVVKSTVDRQTLVVVQQARDRAEQAQKEAVAAQRVAEEARKEAEERTRVLLAQFGWDDKTLYAKAGNDPQAVRQSLYANQALQRAAARGGREQRQAVTVEYYPKDVDQNKVEAALRELGFTLKIVRAVVPNIPTNSMWYGAPVNVEDVKLVALTLIRAGVEIRAIQCLVNKRHLALIQVGADSSVVNNPPLTVEGLQHPSSSFHLTGC